MKRYYLPAKELEKLIWYQNFSSKIGGYAAKYGIAAEIIEDMKNGYPWLAYWMNYRQQNQEWVKKLSTFKDEIISGKGSASVVPTPPSFGTVPTAVEPGIFNRITSLVATIKAHLDYTEADGEDLGIEGTEDNSRDDIQNQQPQISARLVNGGHPEIVWKKNGFDAIDIYVDRGNGNWIFLATDTIPNYIDTAALPTNGQAAVWKYKAIYRIDDEVVGQYSDIVSITVAGV